MFRLYVQYINTHIQYTQPVACVQIKPPPWTNVKPGSRIRDFYLLQRVLNVKHQETKSASPPQRVTLPFKYENVDHICCVRQVVVI